MDFSCKKDLLFGLLIWCIALPLTILGLVVGDSWAGKLVLLMIMGLLVWFWFDTGYSITEKLLKVKSGPIILTIPITDIMTIKEAHIIPSSIVAVDRLAVISSSRPLVYLSPKQKTKFIEEIKKRNPNIQIVYKETAS